MQAGCDDERFGFFPWQIEATRQRAGVFGDVLGMITQGLRCGEHRSGVFITRILGPLEHGQAAAGHAAGVEVGAAGERLAVLSAIMAVEAQ